MTHNVHTNWKENMAFDSHIDTHILRIDAPQETGSDSGPSPKKLLLSALAGCTGMDVVSLLQKMRVNFTAFEILIDADLTNEHPKVYSEIRMVYKISGPNLPKEKVQKAVDLSQEKYCGVSAMLQKNSPIKYTVEFVDTSIPKLAIN